MRWLVDEMLPPAVATELGALGHDAVTVADLHLAGTVDEAIYQVAVESQRTVVTENFADFATLTVQRAAADEPCVPVVFVRKRDFSRRGGLAIRLARHLDRWATANPEPFPGIHWPCHSSST